MSLADVTIPLDDAQAYLERLLTALGVVSDEAQIVAATLVQSEARGIKSHGFLRVPPYVASFREGKYVSPCPMRVVREGPSTLLVDGGLGWGQVIAVRAMRRCIEKARETGVCFAAVRNANHFGAGAYYSELAAKEGMIGIATSSSGEIGDGVCVAPWGGYQALYDTTPIAIALPGDRHAGPTLDMALTVVAQGRLRVYKQRGEPIPEGSALDKEGNPTTDPDAGLEGTVLPIGGYKGYGLGLMIDALCRLLPGSPYPHTPYDGQFLGAIAVDQFIPVEDFAAGMDHMVDVIKASPRRPGFDEIRVPGERAHRAEAEARSRGVTISRPTWEAVAEIARGVGVTPPTSL